MQAHSLFNLIKKTISVKNIIVLFSVLFLASCGGGGGGGGGSSSTGPYIISVATTGLSGSGLQVSLTSDAGVEPMSITANGTRSFSTKVDAGMAYVVAITNTPAGQYCGIDGSSESISTSSNVTISVVCSTVKSLGGTVSGLTGELNLRLSSVETLTIASNGAYVFISELGTTQKYAVKVSAQPVGQLCSISNPGGVVGSTSITNINVNCVTDNDGYQVSGYISGLSGKDGLIILDLNGVEQVASTLTGGFKFATQFANNDAYAVTISSMSSNLECDIINNTGTINAADYPYVNVVCDNLGAGSSIAPKMSSEFLNTGEDVVVTLNGSEDMTVIGSAFNPKAFSTRIAIGEAYNVTLKTLPTDKNCSLFNAFGTIKEGTTPLIKVDCYLNTDPVYTIGGAITGLTGSGLVLSIDDTYTMNISASDTSYITPMGFPSGRYHEVDVLTNPSGQICSVASGYRLIGSSNISDANIICSPGSHDIGGYVDGLIGSGLSLTLNNTEVLPVSVAGDFAFSTMFSDNMAYSVEISSQPSGQFCVISGGVGAGISASVNNIFVRCIDLSYQVQVNVTGYNSTTPLTLSLNNGSNLFVYGNTSSTAPNPVSFADKVANGESYEVQIVRQPLGQVCTLTNPGGIISGADITNVAATCVTDSIVVGLFTVGFSVSGLEGSGLTLQLNGAGDLNVAANGYDTFASALADTDAYVVTVATQPGTPLQYCSVINGSGSIASANVNDIGIVCGNGVQPLYSNGAPWMKHVKNDGIDEYSSSNAWCTSTDAESAAGCLHGGEYKTILLQHLTSCAGVSATDNLGLFDWTCIDNNGIRLVSNKLKTTKFMSDMMDFDAIAFKPNFVTVNDGVTIDSTSSAKWWKNKVILNNVGAGVDSDTVHLITDSITRRYHMEERSALVMKPGTTLSTPASGYATVGTGYVYDFLWFEGNIQGNQAPNSEGIDWSGGAASVVSNTTVQGMASTGIYIDSNHLRLINVNSSNNGNGIVIYGGTYSTLHNVTANNNSGFAGLKTSAFHSTISNVVANGNTNSPGIELDYAHNSTLSNLTANNNATGIDLSSTNVDYGPVVIDGLTANGNVGIGVDLTYLRGGSHVANIEAHNNGGNGVLLEMYRNDAGMGSSVDNVHATGNAGDGLHIAGTLTEYSNIRTSNNGGSGLTTTYNYKNMIQNAVSNNNAGAGFEFINTGGIIAENIVATNNAGRGIQYNMNITSGFDPGVIMNVTSANNAGDGFLANATRAQISSVLIANNGGHGFVTGEKDYHVVNNLVTANNTGFGIDLYSDYDYFTGLLQVGSNDPGDCRVDSGGTQFPNEFTGLEHGTNGSNLNECFITGLSDATLIGGIDASSTVLGEIAVDDTANSDDASGTALFDSITDWFSFEHEYRAWGDEGVLAFADASSQGACNTLGGTCRIWDWSISTTDLGDAGTTPVSYGVLALPDGNDSLSIDWTTYNADSQVYCDTEFPGSTWDGVTTCTSIYLRNAREIRGDSIGNDNALCESGETCLYTPNIGAYQGHGALISAGTFTNGILTDITLMQYESLGR